MSRDQFYDPWAKVGESAKNAMFQYLSSRPDPNAIAAKQASADKASYDAEFARRQLAAPDNLHNMLSQAYAEVEQPTPDNYEGTVPTAPPTQEMIAQRLNDMRADTIPEALRIAGADGKNLGDIYNAFISNAGGSQQAVDRSMIGAGKGFGDTQTGFENKAAIDAANATKIEGTGGGATGANVRSYMAATGKTFDQAWGDMYGGGLKGGYTVDPVSGEYKPVAGFNDIRRNTSTATAEGSEHGRYYAEQNNNLNDQVSLLPQLEDTAKQLSALGKKATYTGAGRVYDSVTKELGMDSPEGAIARTEYLTMVDNQILPLLRQTFGAQFTQREGESLKVTLGDPNGTPEQKDAVLRSFIDQKKANIETQKRRIGSTANNVRVRDSVTEIDPNTVPQNVQDQLKGPLMPATKVQKWGRDPQGNPVLLGGM